MLNSQDEKGHIYTTDIIKSREKLKIYQSKELLKTIKVIPKYSQHWYNYFKSSTIENIYFDTYGQYPFLKEASATSNWKVEYNEHNDISWSLKIMNKDIGFQIIIPNFSINGFIIEKRKINNKVEKETILSFSCIKTNVWEVKFLQSIFSYDDIFFIIDKVIRNLYSKIRTVIPEHDNIPFF